MNENIKNKNGKSIKNENMNLNNETKYINSYNFDIKYEILSPIIKDIQLVSQLIKLVQNHQISDLIFIKGNNSYSIESRFYFKYRNIIDFYVKVLDFIETDYFTHIKYHIYKTHPSSNNFIVNLNLFYLNEKNSKLLIEIILFNNITISQKILNIIYNEFNLNFKYLSHAINNNKQQSLYFISNIVKCDFYTLTQILQNSKIIEYIISGQFKKISQEYNNENDNDEDKQKPIIHKNDIYKIILKKKSLLNDFINVNNVIFKIDLIKIKEDNMIIQYKVILNNTEEADTKKNLFTIIIRKLTSNSCFILIKYIWDLSLDINLITSLRNFINKMLIKIEKICNTAKKC